MQPMAERLGVDYQGLQQFRHVLDVGLRDGAGECGRAHTLDPDAYVIDDTGFPKDGKASPLVARMYSGTLGKTANCQIGCERPVGHRYPRRWPRTGGRTAPPPGTAPRSMIGQWPNRFVPGEPAPVCPTRCAIGRSGVWPWTCSTR
jgi:hypothetical protein